MAGESFGFAVGRDDGIKTEWRWDGGSWGGDVAWGKDVGDAAGGEDGGAARGKMRLLPLIAATYFMVSGGPYGLEDIIGEAGYGWALVMLLVVPVVWSLPTSLMVGELASAVPEEGGYYAGCGGRWGSSGGFRRRG